MTSTTKSNQSEPAEQAPKSAFERAREAHQKVAEQATLPGVPFTPRGTAPMGNELARTPLFSPIKRGRRKVQDMVSLPSPEGIALWYFGKQLDESDRDTYLTALMLAKNTGPDTPVRINRAEFLRLMGRNQSGKAYLLLQQSFKRISTGRLFYDTPQEEGSTPLLGPLRLDKESNEYFFTIPADSLRAFGVRAFGFIDMEKRRMLGVDLAKWLQCYAASHAKGEHRSSVENLKRWSGFEGRLRQFRTNLTTSLEELVRVGVLMSWSLYENKQKVVWVR